MHAIPVPNRDPHAAPVGIIDIGSNSIRLVIYESGARAPAVLFNEKIMAGLGKGLGKTGLLDAQAVERSIAALARYRRLAEDMGVVALRTVATAAVRDASNGADFIARLGAIGLPVELIPGGEEASLAAHGVLAAIPDADGVVGDLGGGSLELARVAGGAVGQGVSIPFGVLRIGALKLRTARALDRAVGKALDKAGWNAAPKGRPLYLVGGSWRALARLDMALNDWPLQIVHQYAMSPQAAQRLVRAIAQFDAKRIKAIAGIASSRVPALGVAAQLALVVARRLDASALIVSASGLREGLLYRDLPAPVRAQDPLIAAAREEGARQGRFPEHGDLLDRWIAPLFADEPAEHARLRHAACLLADIGWRAHPDFRAERGFDAALHGNWTAIDAAGRAMLAQALFTHFGGEGVPDPVPRLLDATCIACAIEWGLAIRLGQRLSGGVAQALRSSRLTLDRESVTLKLPGGESELYGETIERRHKALATALARRAIVATD